MFPLFNPSSQIFLANERIGLLIHQLPQLQGLARQLKRLAALQSTLAEALPANLAASTSMNISEAGELLLFADNGAVAAKLRQMTPRIQVFFRQRGIEVTGIRVQVQVSVRHNPLPQKQIFLTPDGRRAVRGLAARLEDSPLKLALERLSRRGAPSSDHQD